MFEYLNVKVLERVGHPQIAFVMKLTIGMPHALL